MHHSHTAGMIYAIGMGPGNPDYLTLAAMKAWNSCELIFTLAPEGRVLSRCREIAEKANLDTARLIDVVYAPSREKQPGRWSPWEGEIRSLLAEKKTVGFATIGDPLLYSAWPSFRNRFPGVKTKIIPGIPAFLSAAADVNQTLVQGEETLLLAPCPGTGEELESTLASADTTVFYKVFRKTGVLEKWYESGRKKFDLNWSSNTGLGKRETGRGKSIGKQKGNMTTVIIKQTKDPTEGDENS